VPVSRKDRKKYFSILAGVLDILKDEYEKNTQDELIK
jgi:hypothetical protein